MMLAVRVGMDQQIDREARVLASRRRFVRERMRGSKSCACGRLISATRQQCLACAEAPNGVV